MNYYGPRYSLVGFGVWFWFLIVLIVIAVVGLLVIGIIWLVRQNRHGVTRHAAPPHFPASPAEAILAERFARGEISEDEYRTRMATLRGAPPWVPSDPNQPPPAPGQQG